eukprot:TRINITY_DN688_c0_g1_i1.p1 TRINITY_DN688_c0_g1~~TRINITY_DN688_c0_g1_i1.p1  ORF type:complete len:308 (+),score=70.38 TRINITY_DN688_c0_g1_i1:175-1098(+)
MPMLWASEGRIWDWDGSRLINRKDPNQQWTFDGSEFRLLCGNTAEGFNWDGTAMRPKFGPSHRGAQVSGDFFETTDGSREFAWKRSGSSLDRYSDYGERWNIDGDIPEAVICGFVAGILNKSVWAKEDGRDGDDSDAGSDGEPTGEHTTLHTLPVRSMVPTPAKKVVFVRSGRTVELSFGWENNHTWDCIDECPKAGLECVLCETEIPKGTPHLHMECTHQAPMNICPPCQGRLQPKPVPGHKHPLVIFAKPMTTGGLLHVRDLCKLCRKQDRNGGQCPTCSEYLCSACMQKNNKTIDAGCGDCTVM